MAEINFKKGDIIDHRYEVIEILGEGRISVVYKVIDNLFTNQLVLKILLPSYTSLQLVQTRLKYQIDLGFNLQHPNIIRVYDIRKIDNLYYLTMPFIDGISLSKWLIDNKNKKINEILAILRQICSGLFYAHSQSKKRTHGNIKPGNIIIDKEKKIFILDFGLAKLFANIAQFSSTQTYMAPEQKVGGEIDHRADIYSMGIMAFEMFTGEIPHLNRNSASQLNQELNVNTDKILLKAIMKKPSDRYDNIMQFYNELENSLVSISDKKTRINNIANIELILTTYPLSHTFFSNNQRCIFWLKSINALGIYPPLFLVHDLGALLTQSSSTIEIKKPAFLPEDIDTKPYLEFLKRLSSYPCINHISTWDISDSVAGIILSRLFKGISFKNDKDEPDLKKLTQNLYCLVDKIEKAKPEAIWNETKVSDRPDLSELLPKTSMASIEGNFRKLDLDELKFLHIYGPGYANAPDARTLLDMFNLLELPADVKIAMTQVMHLIPQVSQTIHHGGIQLYPMGGYEGLTRKGSLDSLLPTEYVYPDDIFFYRLMNNESLYYGREGVSEKEKELSFIVTQCGLEVSGDLMVLSRGLSLALATTLKQRGYEVWQSFIGSRMTLPIRIEKPSDIHQMLYYQDRGWANPEKMLKSVYEQVKTWKQEYRKIFIFWVLERNWDCDTHEQNEEIYKRLKQISDNHAWFIKTGKIERDCYPESAKRFPKYHVVSNEILTDRIKIEVSEESFDIPELPDYKKLYFTNSIGMKFRYIEPGSFMMGSPDSDEDALHNEKPRHKVTLTKGFYIGVYPVTKWEWIQVMGNNPPIRFKGDNLPVTGVSWEEVQKFINKLNELEKDMLYRLITEAEWEYACRAGSETRYYYGDDSSILLDYAWYFDNAKSKIHPVGEKKTNAWGLYDMHGNIWEWCQDWCQDWESDYPSISITDPKGISNGLYHAFRGGCYGDKAMYCRSAYRRCGSPDFRADYLGFRLAASPQVIKSRGKASVGGSAL